MDKKKEIILGLLLITSCFAFADRYKVLYVNSSDIRVGNKVISVGNIFDDKETIKWTSELQAMKVINLNTKRVMVFAAKALKKKKSSSLYEYLTGIKHLSTRELNHNNIEEWQMDTTLYLLDTLYLSLPPRHNKSATAKIVRKQGKEISIPNNGHNYIITRNLFEEQKSQPIRADIIEYDKERDWNYIIYKNLNIELLPMPSKIPYKISPKERQK